MVRATLLSPAWRLVTVALVATSLASLPTYVLALFLLPPVPPLVMVRSFAVGTALPAAVAWAILRAFCGSVTIDGGTLRLRRGDVDVEVPCAEIDAHPWWVPLPTPGVSLRLRDGRRVPLGTGVPNPTALVTLLEGGGATVRRHAGFLHAATIRERGVAYAILKYAVFGAAPAAILFYTHQHIAYGGTFGQWYLEGPSAWLSTLAQYWATTVILLVSYASFWRIGAELVVWITGALRAEWAPTARWIVEVACALAYFGGVPLLLALRYLA